MYLETDTILQKEVSRLQGLVGSNKTEGIGSHGFVCESPSTFKWDQGHGTFSPLIFDKRATQVFITVLARRTWYDSQATYTGFLVCRVQMNDCDAALVAAFRREHKKEAQLKATIAAKQIAEQLVRSSWWFCISTLQALNNQRKMCTGSHVFYNLIFCFSTGSSKGRRGKEFQDEA